MVDEGRVASPRILPLWVGDLGAIAVALVIGGLAADATETASDAVEAVRALIGVTIIAGLWWRRRWPTPIAVATFIASVASPLAAGAAIVSIYTLAVHRSGRVPILLGALYASSLVVGALLHPDTDGAMVQSVAFGLLIAATALGWGLVVRARFERLEANVRAARHAERERIASDMHDALAHRLSMLSLHAGALELHPDAPPTDLARSAGIIRSHAHLALDDLRAAIGALRDGEDQLLRVPTMDDVPALVEECRDAGMQLHVDGIEATAIASVPAALSAHVYRIIQEGLTNARKHGTFDEVHLTVDVRHGDHISIAIHNSLPAAPPVATVAAGVGLIGLRERVDALGGRLAHGRRADRYHLEVDLPWRQ